MDRGRQVAAFEVCRTARGQESSKRGQRTRSQILRPIWEAQRACTRRRMTAEKPPGIALPTTRARSNPRPLTNSARTCDKECHSAVNPPSDRINAEKRNAPSAAEDNCDLVEFWRTTWSAWRSGQLSSILPSFEREAAVDFDDFSKSIYGGAEHLLQ